MGLARGQAPQSQVSPLSLMSPAEFKAAGLPKLTPSERAALDQWLVKFSLKLLETSKSVQGKGRAPTTRPSYPVEVSHNDELFIINGEKFEAKTYCFNVEEGDQVIFVEGSAYGACASAEFINLRTGAKCEVWCE